MFPSKDAILCTANLQPGQEVEIVFADKQERDSGKPLVAFRVPSIDRQFDLCITHSSAFSRVSTAGVMIGNTLNAFMQACKNAHLVFEGAVDETGALVPTVHERFLQQRYFDVSRNSVVRRECEAVRTMFYKVKEIPKLEVIQREHDED